MPSANPVHRTTASVDAYLAGADPDDSLATIDSIIRRALPRGSRALWQGMFWGGTDQTIIGYGDIEQPRPGGATVPWFLVGLACQSRHLSLYVNAAEDGEYLSKRYGPRLGVTKVGAAAISFTSAQALDHEVLAELVAHAGRVVEHR